MALDKETSWFMKSMMDIGFYKVRLCGNLGGQVGKVGGNDLIEVALFVSFVKCFQSVGKQTEGAADEYASCMHFL